MERKSFQDMDCPVALALERVGEWWSILILRGATHGITRFDEFQRSLGISPQHPVSPSRGSGWRTSPYRLVEGDVASG